MSNTKKSKPDRSNDQPASRCVGLGIASLSLGIIACVVCWVPVVGAAGVPVALMGIGLGITGILVWVFGGSPDSGMCVSGIFVSLVAITTCVFVSKWTVSMVEEFMAETDLQESRQSAPELLNASMALIDGRLVLTNDNSFAWFDVTMTINGEYKWQTSMVPGREVIDMPPWRFKNESGSRFVMADNDDLDMHIETSYGSFYVR